jgi:hypothetical protein
LYENAARKTPSSGLFRKIAPLLAVGKSHRNLASILHDNQFLDRESFIGLKSALPAHSSTLLSLGI